MREEQAAGTGTARELTRLSRRQMAAFPPGQMRAGPLGRLEHQDVRVASQLDDRVVWSAVGTVCKTPSLRRADITAPSGDVVRDLTEHDRKRPDLQCLFRVVLGQREAFGDLVVHPEG